MKIPKVIVPLDDMDELQARAFLKDARGAFPIIKIGLELWNLYGPELVKRLAGDFGVEVFLDLKLHDIPNTVGKSVRALKGLPIRMLTVHMSGGRSMLVSALEEAFVALPNCTLLGVSYLTSLDTVDFKEMWDETDRQKIFERLFELGLTCHMPGMVLSAHELPWLKNLEKKHGREVVKVCPGIRFKDEIKQGQTQDQKRVLSPQEALALGADYLVIGRSLTKARPEELQGRLQELASL